MAQTPDRQPGLRVEEMEVEFDTVIHTECFSLVAEQTIIPDGVELDIEDGGVLVIL